MSRSVMQSSTEPVWCGRWARSAPGHLAFLATLMATCGVGIPASAEPAEEPPLEAEAWIERINQVLMPGRSMTASATLTTEGQLGASKAVEFDLARSTEEGGTSRMLIEVTAPPTRKGTVYQIVVRPGEGLDSWIWSPGLDSLRRIIGMGRTDSFLGSMFTYEDLGLIAPLERRVGEAREVVEDGKRWIVLDSGPYHYYARVRTYVDPESGAPSRVIFFDHAGQRFREQRFTGVQEIDGYLFPTVIEVENRYEDSTSRLAFADVRFDVEVPTSRYSDSIVRQKLGEGGSPAPRLRSD